MLQLKRIQWGHLIISGSFNQLEISEFEDLRTWDFAARAKKNFKMYNSEFCSFDLPKPNPTQNWPNPKLSWSKIDPTQNPADPKREISES